MYKLLNRSNFLTVENMENEMKYFSSKYCFDGYELIQFTEENYQKLKKWIVGYHLRFFPSWMEFYQENFFALSLEYDDKKYWKSMCGGEEKKEELIEYYRKELEIAKKLEVEYVVFHACNIKVRESMTYEFQYTDFEVIDQVISLINNLFDDTKYCFYLLFENLWWPGLKLDNKEVAKYLLEGIQYSKKGFMLDTGHMINCNLEIKNKKEAIRYIRENIERLEEYKNYIYGVHLNLSLSGKYVKETISKNRERKSTAEERMNQIYEHIGNIDYHECFDDEEIVPLLQTLPLKYIVYEFFGYSQKELENKIERQDKASEKIFQNR